MRAVPDINARIYIVGSKHRYDGELSSVLPKRSAGFGTLNKTAQESKPCFEYVYNLRKLYQMNIETGEVS